MNFRILSLAAAMALPVAGAMAQTVTATAEQTAPIPANVVGHWLYDPQGNVIGSIKSLTDGGRTAVIMVGAYFQAGSHEARVPAFSLVTVNGHVTLQGETVQALNAAH